MHDMYSQCFFCGGIAYKTNGLSQWICESRAYSGQCKKDKQAAQSEKEPRNRPCACGSGKKHKHCCGKTKS